MCRLNEAIKYTCSGYRYAPESFNAYKVILDTSGCGNHQYIRLPLTREQNHAIGMACVCKGKDAAAALAKRYDREIMRKPRLFIAYGFLDKNDPTRYHYTQQLRCLPDAPLQSRFQIYQEFKAFVLEGSSYTCTEITLDENFRPNNKTKEEKRYQVIADITKPVLVYLNVA